AAVFACPACRGGLAATPEGAHCESCGARYPATRGFLDLSGGIGDQYEPMTRNVPLRYSGIRPAFLRWKGSNWHPLITVEDEDDYLRTHVEPVDGPILDLAAGTGRWTAVLAERFGPGRVLALDLSTAMLDEIGRTQPDVVAVRGNALNLPFADASLGAVNCWNALQSLPDPAAAVAEVGRCLRPGGTFTVMTFRPSPDPLVRYFQTRPFGVVPVNLSDPDDLRGWLEKAGLTVREVYTPGTFLFVTAVRSDAAAGTIV
ncbi:class I SAM-dependent methyltransferase, partial [Dactylosporangium sp. NPDC005572]|uniref:class I SAM-dependent methyltransferase n=1 Tax=Dactylosporangium sp. NPDC005572 TaxID=3156889 RepID=UPI0033B4C365